MAKQTVLVEPTQRLLLSISVSEQILISEEGTQQLVGRVDLRLSRKSSSRPAINISALEKFFSGQNKNIYWSTMKEIRDLVFDPIPNFNSYHPRTSVSLASKALEAILRIL